MIWFLSFILVFTTTASAKPNLTKIASCAAPKDAKNVMLIKQWHLAPTNYTKSFKEKYPQERNQTAIYQALNDLVKKRKVQLVVGEGCEGEINQDFKTSFNGWDLVSLQKQAQTKGFARIVTHVPLKLEARHGEKLTTVCGDKEKQIQEGNLRLSNLRGWLGFSSRFGELKADAEKLKLYLEAAADILKVPKDTPMIELQTRIQEKIKEELAFFRTSLNIRNTAFVQALSGHEFKTAAIVIGGLHGKDLMDKLQAAGYACEVFEPYGYQREGELLIQEFEKALK